MLGGHEEKAQDFLQDLFLKIVENHVIIPHGSKGNYLYKYNNTQASQLAQ